MNKLKIGETIYNLRKKKGLTQEQLANFIGVSTPAVCKWEGDISYPDITFLPSLAKIFSVTIDELLNYNNIISREEEESIIDKCKESLLKNHNNIDLSLSYIEKYPLNHSLKLNIAILITTIYGVSNGDEGVKKAYEYTIPVFKDIVDNCVDNLISEAASVQLGTGYMIFKDYSKALEIFKKLDKKHLDVTLMMGNIYNAMGEKEKGRKLLQEKLYIQIFNVLGIINAIGETYLQENVVIQKKYIELYSNLAGILEKEGLYNLKFNTVINYVLFYGKHNMQEQCKGELRKIPDIIKEYSSPIKLNNIWFFDTLDIEERNTIPTDYKAMLRAIFESEDLKFVCDSKEFKEIIRVLEYR